MTSTSEHDDSSASPLGPLPAVDRGGSPPELLRELDVPSPAGLPARDTTRPESSNAFLDRLVDAVVERIEDRVVDELERRGRQEWRVI